MSSKTYIYLTKFYYYTCNANDPKCSKLNYFTHSLIKNKLVKYTIEIMGETGTLLK